MKSFLIRHADAFFARCGKLEDIYIPLRSQILLAKYRLRRERYAVLCKNRELVYSEATTQTKVRKRISDRGYTPLKKKLGEVHTFAFIPRLGWHEQLYNDLYELGPVSEFDYIACGFDGVEVSRPTLRGQELRKKLNDEWYKTLVKSHQENPVDWIFVYASGNHVLIDTIRKIQETIGVPVVNMCLDDKHSWQGLWLGEQYGLQIDISRVFDLSWTSSRVTTEWYLAENGMPLYMPEGFDIHTFKPLTLKNDMDISFVGSAYGCRPSIIRFLKARGISIHAFGHGWKDGSIPTEMQVEVYNRSKINLGIGAIGYSEFLTNLKGRDFEIPGCGGGMYLTSFNPDLALHFHIGKEIVCYRSRDEMLELIRYYLTHADEAQEIAKAGRDRCLREHRWLHRYIRILSILGIVENR